MESTIPKQLAGFSIEILDDEHIKKYKTFDKTYIKLEPSGIMMTDKFVNYLEEIQNFQVYPDDTWVLSFPKCGTTWTQEMVWLLLHNLDYETAKNSMRHRYGFIEFVSMVSVKDPSMKSPKDIAAMKRPRFIKSHLPYELLPKQLWIVQPKIVYVSRNPKDAAISYYHHHTLWTDTCCDFQSFIKAFVANRVMEAPYWPHFLRFWEHRNEPYILFNSYEEMKRDLPGVVKKTAAFLEVSISEPELKKLCDHLSFNSMKNNKNLNYENEVNNVRLSQGLASIKKCFIRKGEVGGWKNDLSPELIELFDNWTKQELKDSELADYPFY